VLLAKAVPALRFELRPPRLKARHAISDPSQPALQPLRSPAKAASAPGDDCARLSPRRARRRRSLGDVRPHSHPAGRYGKASLVSLGLWQSVEAKIARAENPWAARSSPNRPRDCSLSVRERGRGSRPLPTPFSQTQPQACAGRSKFRFARDSPLEGVWIRTIGPCREGAGSYYGDRRGQPKNSAGYRWFESISLQQRVTCELDFGRDARCRSGRACGPAPDNRAVARRPSTSPSFSRRRSCRGRARR
jgi:hypothetical protein